MFKNPMFRIAWWSFFTFIADFSALRGLYLGQVDGISVIAATMMSFGLLYLIASYRLDGPEGMRRDYSDERTKAIADRSRSIGFFVLFLCTWFLAFLVDMPSLEFIKQNINLTLASVAMLGMLVHLFSFAWYKYRV